MPVSLGRVLTEALPDWAVWRGVDALAEERDLDSIAPQSRWDVIVETTHMWARRRGLTALVRCTHVPGQMILVGCGSAGSDLFQLDVIDRKLVHGVPVWTAHDLLACLGADETDGVRRVRLGTEGVARILARRSDRRGPTLATLDPEGAMCIATRLGMRGGLALRPGRGARAALELLLAARPLAAPTAAARSAATDRARRRCVVLATLAAGRVAPHDVGGWLETVARDHDVLHA